MRSLLALAVVVLLGVWCVHLVAAQDFQLCTFTDPTTSKKYDLKNLAKLYTSKASASDPGTHPPIHPREPRKIRLKNPSLGWRTDSSGWKYYVSPCQPVRGESRCVAKQSSTTVCQQDTKDVYTLGTTSKGVVAGRTPQASATQFHTARHTTRTKLTQNGERQWPTVARASWWRSGRWTTAGRT
jgi:hypothetical protein